MKSSEREFEILSSIYDEMVFTSDFRQGSLLIKNEEILNNLKECLEAEDSRYGLSSLTNSKDLKINDTINLIRGEPLPRIGLFHLNFEEFLNRNLSNEPKKRFYILDKKVSNNNISQNLFEEYEIYLSLINFIKTVLIPSADYYDKESSTLIYLDTGKIEVPIIYKLKTLKGLNINLLNEITGKFYEDTHKKQKHSIVAGTVKTICSPVSVKHRFEHLLSNMDTFSQSYNDGYKLFTADFSYEKIKDTCESAKIEEMSKIHKIISDIQNHILGIPVATVVVATQMKELTASNHQLMVNIFVLVGALIFTLLVTFAASNQAHSLSNLKKEIDRKKIILEKDYKTIDDLKVIDFSDLYSRISHQEMILCSIKFVVWLGFTMAAFAFFKLSFF